MAKEYDNHFTFWESMKDAIDVYEGDYERQFKMYNALAEYGLWGELPEDDGTQLAKDLISFIIPNKMNLDNSRNFLQKQVERGSKGGSARKVEIEEIEGAVKSAAIRLGKVPTRNDVIQEIEELLGKKISLKTISRNVSTERRKELAEEVLRNGTMGQLNVPGTGQDKTDVSLGQTVMSHFEF